MKKILKKIQKILDTFYIFWKDIFSIIIYGILMVWINWIIINLSEIYFRHKFLFYDNDFRYVVLSNSCLSFFILCHYNLDWQIVYVNERKV